MSLWECQRETQSRPMSDGTERSGRSPCKSKEPVPAPFLSGLMLLAGLEGNLQHTVTQAVAIKAGDSHSRLIVVGHGDKAKALTFVGGEVTDNLDIGDGAERPKELPQDALVCLGGEVVYKDAPAGSGWTSKVDPSQAGHAVNSDGGESGEESRRATMGVILKFNTAFSALYCLLCFSVRKRIQTGVGNGVRGPHLHPLCCTVSR